MPEVQLVAALRAMTEANIALRDGLVHAPAVARARLCLEALAESADLAPDLRLQCDALGAQWSAVGLARSPVGVDGGPPCTRRAKVIPLVR